MRILTRSICLAVFVAGIGCADKDMHASLEKMNEGIELYNAGRVTEAASAFEEAANLSPDNHKAWYNLGQANDKIKKYEEAAKAFEEAVRVQPEDAMYHYRLGKALHEIGQVSQAETHLERAVELEDKLYKAHFVLGEVYAAQDKPSEAAKAWTRSATLAPSFGKPFNKLGKLYTRWDKLDEAISVLDQGRLNVVDGEELTDIFYHLGLAYEKQGNWDKAIEAYTSAIEVRGGNIDALRQRGFAYAEKGDKANARQDLKDFVDQGGGGDAFHLQAANERLFRLTGD